MSIKLASQCKVGMRIDTRWGRGTIIRGAQIGRIVVTGQEVCYITVRPDHRGGKFYVLVHNDLNTLVG